MGGGVSSGRETGGSPGKGYELCLNPRYAWMQKFFSLFPFARGYLKLEKMREADILIRRHVASKISEAERILRDAAGAAAQSLSSLYFASAPTLTPRPMLSAQPVPPDLHQRLMDAANKLNMLSADVLYADSGWAPVSAVQAIREDEILKLCEIDDTMLGVAEALSEAARRLDQALRSGNHQEAQQLAADILAAADRLREILELRREFLRFAGGANPGLTDRVKSAVASAREAIERLLSRVRGG